MKKISLLILVLLIYSCQQKEKKDYKNLDGHLLENEGDLLKIMYRGEADVVQFKMFEGVNCLLEKTQPAFFETQLTIHGLDDGLFSYDILVYQQDSTGNMIPVEYQPNDSKRHFRWIGKNRSINFSKVATFKGEMTDTSISSNYLKEKRGISIYRPEAITSTTPIIYLTDGKSTASYAAYVEALINEGKIVPLMLVGIHSSMENRYQEYVNNGIANEYFRPHEDFFFKEIIPLTEENIANWKGKRYLYGVSNGGAFCMYCGINYPNLFEEIVAFSTVDYISEFIRPIEFKYNEYPKFYMGAGRYEDKTHRDNLKFVEKLKRKDINVQFKTFVSGHDYYVWQIEFLEYLVNEFEK